MPARRNFGRGWMAARRNAVAVIGFGRAAPILCLVPIFRRCASAVRRALPGQGPDRRLNQQPLGIDAMMEPAAQTKEVISFGPFTLVASERLLTRRRPCAAGRPNPRHPDRLVSLPNEVISKRDLMAEVWPDVTVEEGSLRFHIAELRKALGDGKGGARYITTLAGRGYCFVAPVTCSSSNGQMNQRYVLPAFRASTCQIVCPEWSDGQMRSQRFRLNCSLRASSRHGPGGVGKTTVAVAVGHDLLKTFAERRAVRRPRIAERS